MKLAIYFLSSFVHSNPNLYNLNMLKFTLDESKIIPFIQAKTTTIFNGKRNNIKFFLNQLKIKFIILENLIDHLTKIQNT